jgi:hypothetical protein
MRSWFIGVSVLLSLICTEVASQEYRIINESGNNVNNPTWGTPNIDYIRLSPPAYSDGISSPNTGIEPRVISNLILGRDPNPPVSTRPITDFLTYWGQFLDHDFDLTLTGSEQLVINIPKGDPSFDPHSWGNVTLPFSRSQPSPTVGVREQFNAITSFIDGSQVYGSDQLRATALRALTGGLLLTSPGNLLPFNTFGFAMANDANIVPNSQIFFTGDVRGNENVGLSCIQTLWVREHNRLANQFHAQNASLVDEDLYQLARKWVIGEMQSIFESEYEAIILGNYQVPPYTGYNASVNPGIFNEFATGAFRYGHSEVSSFIKRLDYNGNDIGDIPLKNGFFNPTWINSSNSCDSILLGLTAQKQQQVDTLYIDDIRNFLFGPPGSGGQDLGSRNILRGRDHGLPHLNGVRAALNLPVYTTFDQISSVLEVSQNLSIAYNGNISLVDLYIGGLAEDHIYSSNLGETFFTIVSLQYSNIRSGDRYWYNQPSMFTAAEISQLQQTTVATVILRNTAIPSMQCHVMTYGDSSICTAPVSTTGAITSSPITSGATSSSPVINASARSEASKTLMFLAAFFLICYFA